MKAIICLLFSFFWVSHSYGGSRQNENGLFNLNTNRAQYIVEAGLSWHKSNFENLYFASVSYQIPSEIFGLRTRRRFEIGGMAGSGCEKEICDAGAKQYQLNHYDTPIAGISEQLILLENKYLSVTFALGGYLKKPSYRIDSAFTFGERLALASAHSNYTFEAFIRHFSNGSITPNNGGHDFVGISFSGKF